MVTGWEFARLSQEQPASVSEWLTGLGPYAVAAASVWWMLNRSDRRESDAAMTRRREDRERAAELKALREENAQLRDEKEQLLIRNAELRARLAEHEGDV